jgi:uncharacterized protein YjbJ (UPF0337 family)
MNQDKAAGKWLEIKGEVQKAWGQLTSDELEKSKGDMKAIAGLIQQKYGDVKEDHRKTLSDIFSRLENKKDSAVESVKETLKS